MTGELSLRVGGVWAQSLGPNGNVGNLEATWVYSSSGGGLKSVKWTMDLPDHFWSNALRAQTVVEVMRGDFCVGRANITDVDRTTWSITADGRYRQGEKYFHNGVAMSLIDALELAISDGLDWAGVEVNTLISSFDVEADDRSSISEILTTFAVANSAAWGLRPDNTVYLEAMPYQYQPDISPPSWAVRPGVPLMPFTDGTFFNRAKILYPNAGSTLGVLSTYLMYDTGIIGEDEESPEGGRTFNYVYPHQTGGISLLASEIVRRMALRYIFTQGLDIYPGELTTTAGTKLDSWAAGVTILGHLGVHYGAISTRNNSAVGESVQWIAGSATYQNDTGALHLASVDLESRTLVGFLKSVAEATLGSYSPRWDPTQNGHVPL